MSWDYIVFTDLHVEARTLDRCIDVLRRVRRLAKETGAKVVCTGDFWERRGTLQVRQLHEVQREFEQWERENISLTLIPGNHDQVSADGMIHGVDVFSAFSNIRVATEPLFDFEQQVVFLPWREDPQEQAELFWALAGGDWTVFAHAEVKGATTNHSHVAPGRVTTTDIEKGARACYVGHYHKRQKLGDRTWYIGSPFEMNFGERDMPHGVALISLQQVEPQFIDFDDMPKHVRMELSEVPARSAKVRPCDIVEVLWPVETPQATLESALALLPALDVRPRPFRATEDVSHDLLTALTLEDALEEYVKGEDVIPNVTEEVLTSLGRALLHEVQTKPTAPLGSKIEFQQVTAADFCAIRGLVSLPLSAQGLVLLRGDQGVGKTSLLDAVTWCLYGATTPRKAGGDASSLTGDDVIHDDASQTLVRLFLLVDESPVLIERAKKRGKGAKITISGWPEVDGVRDQQELIERIVGLDFALWRACVSLGQGAVSNFLTATDKRRKEILSTAYGLDACAPAGKLAKERLSRVLTRIDAMKREIATREGGIAELRAQDYAVSVQSWDVEREAEHRALEAESAQYKQAIEQCELGLVGEDRWLASKDQHTAHLRSLTDQLSKVPVLERMTQLQGQIQDHKAEHASLTRAGTEQRGHLQRAMGARQSGSGVVCPACKRPFDAASGEEHIEALEKSIQSIDAQLETQNIRLSDLTQALGALSLEQDAARAGVRAQIEDTNRALGQIGQALSTFAQLRTNKTQAEFQLARVTEAITRARGLTNPWRIKQQEQAARVASYEQELSRLQTERRELDLEEATLDFWVRAFSSKGLPVVVLRSALTELELHVNRFLGELTQGEIYASLEMTEEDLRVSFRQYDPFTKQLHDRRYEQLSGGQRRCSELSFSPFALGELIFARTGSRVRLLLIDELTTHLGAQQKALAVQLLAKMSRDTVIVVDHDVSVQGEFDHILDFRASVPSSVLERVR